METRESLIADIAYLDACITDIHERAGDAALPEDQAADFKAGVQLRDEKRAALKNIEERHAELERLAADKPAAIERGDGPSRPRTSTSTATPTRSTSRRCGSTRPAARSETAASRPSRRPRSRRTSTGSEPSSSFATSTAATAR